MHRILQKIIYKKADVAVEFTTPVNAANNIRKCIDAGLPIVCGTTGWLSDFDTIKDLCIKENGTFLYASNYSIRCKYIL